MANASTVGALRVVLGLDTAEFEGGITRAQAHLRKVGKQMEKTGANLAKFGASLSAAITVPIIAAAGVAMSEAVEMRDALGQVSAALDSVGNSAQRSLAQFQEQADKLAGSSLFEDDAILRDVTTALVRFGTTSGAIFDRAQQAIVDYAAGAKKDLPAATAAIGRALSDPEKAAGRLAKAGVILTDAQQAQIAAMMKVGNTAGAQGVILSALEGKYKGAAQAARDAASPFERIQLTFKNIAGQVGTLLLPTMDRVAKVFEGLGTKFQGLSPQMQKFIVIGLGIAAALGPVLVVVGAVVAAIGVLIASPLLPFIAAAAAGAILLGAAFARWHKEIIPVVMAFGQQVADVVGPKLQPLMKAAGDAARALGAVFVAMFSDRGGDGSASSALKNFGMIVSRVLGVLADIFTGAFGIATNILKAFAALLRGDVSGVFEALGNAVKAAGMMIVNVFKTAFPEAVQAVQRMVEGVTGWLKGKLFDVLEGVIRKVEFVSDAFFKLYDAVVGHSYVPDMVLGIGTWMAKLQQVMVDPADKATKTTAEKFEALRDKIRGIFEGLMTDREKLDLSFADEMTALRSPEAARQYPPDVLAAMIRRAQARYDTASAGIDADGLTLPTIPDLTPLDQDPAMQRLQEAWARMQEKIAASKDAFADAFENGINAALRGDWRGVLQSIFGDVMHNALQSVGRSLFDAFDGSKPGGVSLGSIGSTLASVFGKLPGFSGGATIQASGASGIDSQLMSFWKSPREQVTIGDPSKSLGGGGQMVHVNPSPYFDVVVTDLAHRAAMPLAMQAGVAATQYSAATIPRQMSRSGRQKFRGGFG